MGQAAGTAVARDLRELAEEVEFINMPLHINFIDGGNEDPEGEAARYTALLKESPLDIVCRRLCPQIGSIE